MATTSTHPQDVAPDPPADRIRIVATPGVRAGRPRIDGHRVTVADVAVWHERQGMSPDEIVDRHPSLTLTDVYAALAYYFENRDRIDADIVDAERRADEFRGGRPSILERARKRTADASDDPIPPG
jgi:uncharacterized protein (DUF433 family)